MTLEIRNFADAGNLDTERLIVRAIEAVDIGTFVVLRSKTNEEGAPISGVKTAYWFPDLTVETGDLVVLYTKAGKTSKKKLPSGKTAHFYYWHQKSALWGTDQLNTAVLIKAANWSHKSPDR